MSMEAGLVAVRAADMGAAMFQKFLHGEVCKGCTPDIAPIPAVCLEPPFADFRQGPRIIESQLNQHYLPATVPNPDDLVRLKLWLSPGFAGDFRGAEELLKQLTACYHPVAFEVVGNRESIEITFLCHCGDRDVVIIAFHNTFPECRLVPELQPLLHRALAAHRNVDLLEFFSQPPYTHLLTRPSELITSPTGSFLNALAGLDSSCIGIYQVLFAPVDRDHDWNHNIQLLLDIEYRAATLQNGGPGSRYAQQVPSAELRGMALDADQKSHNDKPLFSALARVAIAYAEETSPQMEVRALACFLNRIQHGGRPLRAITHHDFLRVLTQDSLLELIRLGISRRAGMILNSQELSSLVNLPPAPASASVTVPIQTLDGFPLVLPQHTNGIVVGHRCNAGRLEPVVLPENIHLHHGQFVGRSGRGKSTLIERLILQHTFNDAGFALIDPHGDLSERYLGLLPESYHDRVVYFELGDLDFVPVWNPLHLQPGQDPSRIADDIVKAFRIISDGFGDRLGNVLRQTLSGIIRLGDATLLDVDILLSGKSTVRDRKREQVLATTKNPVTENFWRNLLLNGLSKADVAPAHNKIGKIFSSDSVAQMLSQPESKIDFRRIMDEGYIFIANLSRIGHDQRAVIGSVILSLFYVAALGRSTVPEQSRRKFYLYVEEAHQFVPEALTEVMDEARKYGMSLIFSHQNLSQFRLEQIRALYGTGFTVIFDLVHEDLKHLLRALGGDVYLSKPLQLARGEALIRMDHDWARINTLPPQGEPDPRVRDRIVAMSRERYYVRIADLQRRRRGVVGAADRLGYGIGADESEEDYQFDRLCAPKES